MTTYETAAWAVGAFLAASLGTSRLEGQCTLPPGDYTISATLRPDSTLPEPVGTICFEIRGESDTGRIDGFGFNLAIAGGPITNVSVTPGFPLAGVARFESTASPGLDFIAAVGFGDLGDQAFVGLDLLATLCITMDPTASSLLGVFGGSLALSGGLIPVDHLVVEGCDVYTDSTPALTTRSEISLFRRGDADANGTLNITDPIYTLNFLFGGGEKPPCEDAADGDDTGGLNITDPIRVLNFLFLGGPAPPVPSSATCGADPTPDDLSPCTYRC